MVTRIALFLSIGIFAALLGSWPPAQQSSQQPPGHQLNGTSDPESALPWLRPGGHF